MRWIFIIGAALALIGLSAAIDPSIVAPAAVISGAALLAFGAGYLSTAVLRRVGLTLVLAPPLIATPTAGFHMAAGIWHQKRNDLPPQELMTRYAFADMGFGIVAICSIIWLVIVLSAFAAGRGERERRILHARPKH